MAASTASCAVSVASSFAIAAIWVTGPDAAVVGGGRVVDEQPRGLDARGDVGEPVRDRLEVLERAAERVRGAAACATAASSAACAIPTANAPTLGRKRSSVRIATREAAVDLAEHVLGGDGDAVEARAGRSGAGRGARSRSPVRPGVSRGHRRTR